jgi:hypothetical protein
LGADSVPPLHGSGRLTPAATHVDQDSPAPATGPTITRRSTLERPAWRFRWRAWNLLPELAEHFLDQRPTVIAAAGNKPKRTRVCGRVNSGRDAVSVARMVSPEGWLEPAAAGVRGNHRGPRHAARGARTGRSDVRAGQVVVAPPASGFGTPQPELGGAEWAIWCPRFRPPQ